MGHFDGKIVVVTGAAGGIGTAISTRFASEGGTVISVDKNAEWLGILDTVMGDKGLKTELLELRLWARVESRRRHREAPRTNRRADQQLRPERAPEAERLPR